MSDLRRIEFRGSEDGVGGRVFMDGEELRNVKKISFEVDPERSPMTVVKLEMFVELTASFAVVERVFEGVPDPIREEIVALIKERDASNE